MNTSIIISIIELQGSTRLLLKIFSKIHPCTPILWHKEDVFFSRRPFYLIVAKEMKRHLADSSPKSNGFFELLDLWQSLEKAIEENPVKKQKALE